MNQLLIKQISILSAILGAILAILTLIPFVNGFAFFTLLVLVAAIILIYLKKNDLIGIIDIKEGAAFGAIIGFVSFVAFSVVFIPLVSLVGLIFKGYYTYGIIYLLKASGFFVLIMLVLFMSIISALMNSFTGLLTAYIYEFLTGIKKESNESIEFEIKED